MIRQRCHVCTKPLGAGVSPALMDRHGRYYHLPCWCRRMDAMIQEQRAPIAERKARSPARKKRRT
ncbi:MAG TPA: hypothetical protein VHF87_11250 [Methylomirabilota bacterium]|jgi:hypothetical protein|nr:hypothetical protein [Methylomirabilota bacterium]